MRGLGFAKGERCPSGGRSTHKNIEEGKHTEQD